MSPESIAIIGLFFASVTNSIVLYTMSRNIENIYRMIK